MWKFCWPNNRVSARAGVFSTVGPSGLEEVWAVVAGEAIDVSQLRDAANLSLPTTPIANLIVVAALPKNANGKLLREELKKLATS